MESASTKDIYTANKYISNPPLDYSNTRILSLQTTTPEGNVTLASENSKKGLALAKTFFPPLPIEMIIPLTAYPKPLQAQGFLMKNNIHTAIHKLNPFKVPGIDRIQNIIIQQCAEMIIDHLYHLFQVILKYNTYPD